MSYGSLFLPEDRRLKPDIGKVYYDLIDKEIQEGIMPPEPHLQQLTQKLSRLYDTSVDDPHVHERLKSLTSKKRSPLKKGSVLDHDNISTQSSIDTKVSKRIIVPRKREELLTITTALQKDHARDGGKYHPPPIIDSYEPRFEVCKVLSTASNPYVCRASLLRALTTLTHQKCGLKIQNTSATIVIVICLMTQVCAIIQQLIHLVVIHILGL